MISIEQALANFYVACVGVCTGNVEFHVTRNGPPEVIGLCDHIPTGARAKLVYFDGGVELDEQKETARIESLSKAFRDMIILRERRAARRVHGTVQSIQDDGWVTLTEPSDTQFFWIGSMVCGPREGGYADVLGVDRAGGRLSLSPGRKGLRVGSPLVASCSGEVTQ